MPQMSLPLHPQMLQGFEGGSRVPGVVGPAQPALPPGTARGAVPPSTLGSLRPGSSVQPVGGNPFQGNANPSTPGATGTRYFATDTRGTIFFDTVLPIVNPIPAAATPIQ